MPETALPIYRGPVKVADVTSSSDLGVPGKFLIKLPIKSFLFYGSTDNKLRVTCTVCQNKGCHGIVRKLCNHLKNIYTNN